MFLNVYLNDYGIKLDSIADFVTFVAVDVGLLRRGNGSRDRKNKNNFEIRLFSFFVIFTLLKFKARAGQCGCPMGQFAKQPSALVFYLRAHGVYRNCPMGIWRPLDLSHSFIILFLKKYPLHKNREIMEKLQGNCTKYSIKPTRLYVITGGV